MKTLEIKYIKNESQLGQKIHSPSRWKKVILLCILFYEGIGCLLGGSMLILAPDGRLMDMPVEIMNHMFNDFLIPGNILFALGILNSIAFVSLLRKSPLSWLTTGLALGGLFIWFWIEIAILQELHWLHAMWGFPVVAGIFLAISLFSSKKALLKGFLICGCMSSLLYVAINIIVALNWDSYSSVSQTVSELSAVGAPTRYLWIVLSTPYTLLMIAFAYGVFVTARENRRLRTVGRFLIAYAFLGILWPFAPMHLREALANDQGTFSDTVHIALGAVTEVIFFLAVGFAATVFGRKFRFYSISTLVLLILFGILTFLEAPAIAESQPTPLIGVWERINIGLFLLWITVLSVILLKKETEVIKIAVN
jgi:hypothetical protein